MSDRFLDKAYSASDSAEALYDAWAATYDAELGENGYVTPARCAKALAAHSRDLAAPILDFGCGTGLSGLALKLAGFETLDGVDVSADMLKGAAAKDIYRTLSQIAPSTPLTHPKGHYAAITCIGVIGTGAAPVEVFDLVMDGLATGGLTVLSLNDHALAEPRFEAKLASYTDTGRAQLLFQDYGPHIPGINLNANVYVLEKT